MYEQKRCCAKTRYKHFQLAITPSSRREQHLDNIADHALRYLQMDNVRTANAWLRVRFMITVESRRVTDIQVLF